MPKWLILALIVLFGPIVKVELSHRWGRISDETYEFSKKWSWIIGIIGFIAVTLLFGVFKLGMFGQS
jgi:hypothetical protein